MSCWFGYRLKSVFFLIWLHVYTTIALSDLSMLFLAKSCFKLNLFFLLTGRQTPNKTRTSQATNKQISKNCHAKQIQSATAAAAATSVGCKVLKILVALYFFSWPSTAHFPFGFLLLNENPARIKLKIVYFFVKFQLCCRLSPQFLSAVLAT